MTEITTETRYSLKTGLLHSLALDCTGRGPASRSWRWRGFNDRRHHIFGQMIGCVLMLALIVSMTTLAINGYGGLGATLAAAIIGCTVCANIIAARLP